MSITTRREASLSYWGPGSIYPLQSGILVCTSYPIVWQWKDEVVNDQLKNLLGYPENPLRLATEVQCSVFPNQWYCPRCKTLIENLHFTGWQSLLNSPSCTQPEEICSHTPGHKKGVKPKLVPLRAVLACSEGHISPLPIRSQLKKRLGLANLHGSVKISPSRTGSWAMSRVWLEDGNSQQPEKFRLAELMKDIICPGQAPWLGKDEKGVIRIAPCDLKLDNDIPGLNQDPDKPTPQLKMLVVGDSALYTPLRVSVIKRGQSAKEKFIEYLQEEDLLGDLEDTPLFENQKQFLSRRWKKFQKKHGRRFPDFTIDPAFVDQCMAAQAGEVAAGKTMNEIKCDEVSYFHESAQHRDETQPVVVRPMGDHGLEQWISTVLRVDKVTLTGAFVGFSRVGRPFAHADGACDFKTEAIRFYGKDYKGPIPVSESIGEGVYIELNADTLQKWMGDNGRLWTGRFPMGLDQKKPDPRYVLAHTISHALMTRFAMLCGYPLVSLHERIYTDFGAEGRVGALIYTTGDSMGSLGGLAGLMDKSDEFRETFIDAIRETAWCSSDPVCMEAHHGSCYACLHLPEMACENFNRGLDRGTIWGLPDKPECGYFNGLN